MQLESQQSPVPYIYTYHRHLRFARFNFLMFLQIFVTNTYVFKVINNATTSHNTQLTDLILSNGFKIKVYAICTIKNI